MSEQATHFAVPMQLFQAIAKTLEGMPYSQVSSIMLAMNQCRPIKVNEQPELVAPPEELENG